jgi:hypothetical protein
LDKDVAQRKRLLDFLQKMPGMVELGFFVEKHIAVCEAQVEILALVDVEACMKLE